MDIRGTRTEANLRSAFAGETQARRRGRIQGNRPKIPEGGGGGKIARGEIPAAAEYRGNAADIRKDRGDHVAVPELRSSAFRKKSSGAVPRLRLSEILFSAEAGKLLNINPGALNRAPFFFMHYNKMPEKCKINLRRFNIELLLDFTFTCYN